MRLAFRSLAPLRFELLKSVTERSLSVRFAPSKLLPSSMMLLLLQALQSRPGAGELSQSPAVAPRAESIRIAKTAVETSFSRAFAADRLLMLPRPARAKNL